MKSKNIFITGGNRGIGRGLVELLSADHNVVFSVRDKQKGEETIQNIGGVQASYVVMDVNENESINIAVKKMKNQMDSIDILFNNAGILIPEYDVPAIETSEDSILESFGMLFKYAVIFLVGRYFLDILILFDKCAK